jgi:hypothetical protein
MLWQAIKATDNPMEEWLKRGYYRNDAKYAKAFASAQIELDEFQKVTYAMTVEVEWTGDAWEWRNTEFWDDYDNFKFAINLPNAGPDSVIDCRVSLTSKGKTVKVFHETIRPRVVGSQVLDPHVAMIGPVTARSAKMPSYIWWEPPAIRTKDGRLSYGGQLKLDDDTYNEAQVELSYWPDQNGMPDFVLPDASQRMLVGKK